MDVRFVIALWAAAFVPLAGFVLAGRGVERGLLWSIRFGLTLLLLTPFVVSAETFFPFILGKALTTRGLIEIVFGMWAILAILRPDFRPPRSLLALAFAGFLAGNLIAAAAGVSFNRSFWSNYERMQGVFDLAHWFVLFVVLVSVVRGARQWMTLVNAVVGVGFVSALLAVAQRYDLSRKFFPFLEGSERLSSTLGNATYVGTYMAIVALLALGLFVNAIRRPPAVTGSGTTGTAPEAAGKRQRAPAPRTPAFGTDVVTVWLRSLASNPERKIVWPVAYLTVWALFLPAVASGTEPSAAFLGALIASLAVFVLWLIAKEPGFWGFTFVAAIWVLLESGSRGGGVALGAGLVVFAIAFALTERRVRFRVAGIGSAVLVLAGGMLLVFAGESEIVRRLANTNPLTERAASTGAEILDRGRRTGARTAVEGFLARPLTGWGPENFLVPFRLYQRASDYPTPPENLDQAHNRPLEVLATTGLVGFVPYVVFWVLVIYFAVRRVRHAGRATVFSMSLLAAASAYLAQSLFLFETAAGLILFAILAAWTAGGEASVARQVEVFDLEGGRLVGGRKQLAGRARRRAAASRPGAVERRTRPGPSAWGKAGAAAAVAVLFVLAVALIHVRAYRAAYLVIRPAPVEQLAANLETFPPLATMGRMALAEVAAARLGQFEAEERTIFLEVTDDQLGKALDTEPENILLWLSASRFYASASRFQEGFVERARQATQKALRLGPHTHEAHERAVEQAFLERDIEAARAAVGVWKSEHPNQGAERVNQFDARLAALAEELARSRESGG